jgi:hypothetical protein
VTAQAGGLRHVGAVTPGAGKADGANSSLRELGGVFGTAAELVVKL